MSAKPHSRELCRIAAAGDAEQARSLLTRGHDPDWPASDPDFDEDDLENADWEPWEPPLFLAGWYGHTELAQLLLDYEANPNVTVWSRRLVRDGVKNYTTNLDAIGGSRGSWPRGYDARPD
jgi:hypothetical protein